MTEKRYYIVYKTTCLKNGKYYIGCHATDNLNDNYLGSGVELKRDIARYGRSAFVRETLYECSTHEEAALKERELVNRDVVNDPNSYNKNMGGQVRGVKIGEGEEARERKRERNRERYQNDPIFRVRVNKRRAELKRKQYHDDQAFRERVLESERERYRNDEAFRESEKARHRKKYQSDPIYREQHLERCRKNNRKNKFKQKLTTSTEFRSAFVLRCKQDATLLQKTLELFKHDADFCELLKNLIENQ